MKTVATLTSKGQITIPKIVRQALGVRAGDGLEFDFHAGRMEVRATRARRASAGVLKPYLRKGWKAPSVAGLDAGMARALAKKQRGA